MGGQAGDVREVDRETLKRGLAAGTMLVVDVREPHEYAAGHIPGSVSMPLSVFDPSALAPGDGRQVVFSCNSGMRTLIAIERAQASGQAFDTHYPGSFKDWLAAGEPVATGS